MEHVQDTTQLDNLKTEWGKTLQVNSPAPVVELDSEGKSSVDYIIGAQEKAYKEALALVSNPQYSDTYKSQEITRLFEEAAAEVESRATGSIEGYEMAIEKNTLAARIPIAVDPAEATALMYVKSAIEARASNMTIPEFAAFWRGVITAAAVDPKEKLTLRVMADFWPRLTGRDERGKPVKLAGYGQTPELVALTNAALMTTAQKNAAGKLAQATANKEAATRARMKAKNALRPGWKVIEGEIWDAGRVQMRNQIRGGF